MKKFIVLDKFSFILKLKFRNFQKISQITPEKRAFSLTWPAHMAIYETQESVYIRKEFTPTGLLWHTNMAAVSLLYGCRDVM